jgi:hypothetical protein
LDLITGMKNEDELIKSLQIIPWDQELFHEGDPEDYLYVVIQAQHWCCRSHQDRSQAWTIATNLVVYGIEEENFDIGSRITKYCTAKIHSRFQ